MYAAFILGTIPALVIYDPAATAQMPADKPDKPNEPRGDGCIPLGVTKYPSGRCTRLRNATAASISVG